MNVMYNIIKGKIARKMTLLKGKLEYGVLLMELK